MKSIRIFNFIFGLIGIALLTVFCLIGAFLVPQNAYWFMTPSAVDLLEKYGIPRELKQKDKITIGLLMLIVGVGYIVTIIIAGKQGVASSMNLWQLSLRFVIMFWMTSIFDAIVLDWWMFTKTDIFGILIKTKTGKTPDVMRVES
ncbi:hypothetical protein SAMN04487934_10832 [Eubacterium ruminantium]|nr:hypothetical protein SAMN04487934_10832 [Eubacterium ruminantium]